MNGIINCFFCGFSIKYVVIDPAKVSKYGLFTAVFQVLDNKVDAHDSILEKHGLLLQQFTPGELFN